MVDCAPGQAEGTLVPTGPSYTVAGNVASDETVWFDGGRSFAAGQYRVSYAGGCMRYSSTTGWGVSAAANSWRIVKMVSGAPQDVANAPCTVNPVPSYPYGLYADGGWETPEMAIAANSAAEPVVIDHSGGPLGIRLYDSNYSDNTAGRSAPSWTLQAVAPCEAPPVFTPGKCQLPQLPRIPQLPVIQVCDIPQLPSPITECPGDLAINVPVPEPPLFTCPPISFQVQTQIRIGEPHLELQIRPFAQEDECGAQQCGFNIAVQLQVPYPCPQIDVLPTILQEVQNPDFRPTFDLRLRRLQWSDLGEEPPEIGPQDPCYFQVQPQLQLPCIPRLYFTSEQLPMRLYGPARLWFDKLPSSLQCQTHYLLQYQPACLPQVRAETSLLENVVRPYFQVNTADAECARLLQFSLGLPCQPQIHLYAQMRLNVVEPYFSVFKAGDDCAPQLHFSLGLPSYAATCIPEVFVETDLELDANSPYFTVNEVEVGDCDKLLQFSLGLPCIPDLLLTTHRLPPARQTQGFVHFLLIDTADPCLVHYQLQLQEQLQEQMQIPCCMQKITAKTLPPANDCHGMLRSVRIETEDPCLQHYQLQYQPPCCFSLGVETTLDRSASSPYFLASMTGDECNTVLQLFLGLPQCQPPSVSLTASATWTSDVSPYVTVAHSDSDCTRTIDLTLYLPSSTCSPPALNFYPADIQTGVSEPYLLFTTSPDSESCSTTVYVSLGLPDSGKATPGWASYVSGSAGGWNGSAWTSCDYVYDIYLSSPGASVNTGCAPATARMSGVAYSVPTDRWVRALLYKDENGTWQLYHVAEEVPLTEVVTAVVPDSGSSDMLRLVVDTNGYPHLQLHEREIRIFGAASGRWRDGDVTFYRCSE